MRGLILVLLLLPMSVMAGNALIEWIQPSERTDNTGIALSEIGGNRLYLNGATTPFLETLSGATTSTVVTLPDGQTHNLTITAFDVDGRESAQSLGVQVVMPPKLLGPLKAPTGLTATVLP